MKSGCVLVKSARCIGFGSGRIQTGRELAEVSAFRIKPQLSKRKTHKATLHRVCVSSFQHVKEGFVSMPANGSMRLPVTFRSTKFSKDSSRRKRGHAGIREDGP